MVGSWNTSGVRHFAAATTHNATSNPFHPVPNFRHPFIQAQRAHERSLNRALDREKKDFLPNSFQDWDGRKPPVRGVTIVRL